MTDYDAVLREALPRVRDEIAEAERIAGRPHGSVRLVAVTKGHPLEAVRAARAAGLAELGENRVDELEDKVATAGREGVRWHMIGHVQRRKAPRALEVADLIHSVDSVRLAERLERAADEAGRIADVLVQVNTSGEDVKSGFSVERAVEEVLEVAGLPHLRVHGLMTMAPFVDDERVLRTTFRRLRETLEDVRRRTGRVGAELSMGMTNDLRYAVEEGSTMVRIGTALFGERPGSDGPPGRDSRPSEDPLG
jgi:hypothetical protein